MIGRAISISSRARMLIRAGGAQVASARLWARRARMSRSASTTRVMKIESSRIWTSGAAGRPCGLAGVAHLHDAGEQALAIGRLAAAGQGQKLRGLGGLVQPASSKSKLNQDGPWRCQMKTCLNR
jgi:hypothetical protein